MTSTIATQQEQWLIAVTTPNGLICSCRFMSGRPAQVIEQLRTIAPKKAAALELVRARFGEPPLAVADLSEMAERMAAANIPTLPIAVYRNRSGWHSYILNQAEQ
jgi:hypothetical protein